MSAGLLLVIGVLYVLILRMATVMVWLILRMLGWLALVLWHTLLLEMRRILSVGLMLRVGRGSKRD